MSALASLVTRVLPQLIPDVRRGRYTTPTIAQSSPTFDPAVCVHAREENLVWEYGAFYRLNRVDHFLIHDFNVGKADIPPKLEKELKTIFDKVIRDVWYKLDDDAGTRVFHTFPHDFALNVSQAFKLKSLKTRSWTNANPGSVAAIGGQYLDELIRARLTKGPADKLSIRTPFDSFNTYFPLSDGQSIGKTSHMTLSELRKAYGRTGGLTRRKLGEAGGPFPVSRLLFLGAVPQSIRVEIIGRASSKGNNAENKALSQKRAKAVADRFKELGKTEYGGFESRVTALGEEATIAKEGADETERAIDRSVEIRVYQSLSYLDTSTKDELLQTYKGFYSKAKTEIIKHADAADIAIKAGDASKLPTVETDFDHFGVKGKPLFFLPNVWKMAEQQDYGLQIGLSGLEFAIHAPLDILRKADELKLSEAQAKAFSIRSGKNGPFTVEDANKFSAPYWPIGILFGLGSLTKGDVWRTPRSRTSRHETATRAVKKFAGTTLSIFPTDWWATLTAGMTTSGETSAAKQALDKRLDTLGKHGEQLSLMFAQLTKALYAEMLDSHSFEIPRETKISVWEKASLEKVDYTFKNSAFIKPTPRSPVDGVNYFYSPEMRRICRNAKHEYFKAISRLALTMERCRGEDRVLDAWSPQWDDVSVAVRAEVLTANAGIRSWFWR